MLIMCFQFETKFLTIFLILGRLMHKTLHNLYKSWLPKITHAWGIVNKVKWGIINKIQITFFYCFWLIKSLDA